MADSQEQYNYKEEGDEIQRVLSNTRFLPYLSNTSFNQQLAFNLYLYNARLSKAFLYPLHILEVALRNSISSILSKDFGAYWPTDVQFRALLSEASLKTLDMGISRAKTRNTHDIVSTLTFDFWSNLFRSEYDRSLWQTRMPRLLPNTGITRKMFQNQVKEINKFRNRVAHYEPIHNLNITEIYSNILTILKCISVESMKWVKHHSTVNLVIRSKPSLNIGGAEDKPHFHERADSNFETHVLEESLSSLSGKRFIICINTSLEIKSVIEKAHIYEYLLTLRENNDLIIDLRDHKLVDVIRVCDTENNSIDCHFTSSFSKANKLLKKSIKYLAIKNESEILGIIAKSHRIYL